MAERAHQTGFFTRWNQARRADGLALRHALPDRLLPLLVAAMAVLAALALAGATGAQILSARWSSGAASMLTVQVPDPDTPAAAKAPATPLTRSDAVLAALADTPGAARVHRLDKAELDALLAPWLGRNNDFALTLPAIIELHMATAPTEEAGALARRLAAIAPGTLVERNAEWGERLGRLADSLHSCALLAVAIVAGIAVVLIMATTRAGLAARRMPIELIHAMGATDGYIAGRFARRTALLAFIGGLAGSVLALPLLVLLSHVAAPFATAAPPPPSAAIAAADWTMRAHMLLDTLPPPLIATLLALAPAAALIGWLTTQATVRAWLRTLP